MTMLGTIISLVGFLLMTQIASAIGSRGTLVVVVPAKDGFVIASDTRSHTAGIPCDGNSKMSVVGSAIVAGTATATWISVRYPLWAHDPCGDIAKNGIVFFDAKATAASFLEQEHKPIWEVDLARLADRLTREILDIHAREPAYVRSFAGRTMFQIVLSAYDSGAKISHARAFQINLTEQYQINVVLTSDYKFQESSTPDYLYFGDTPNVYEHVILGAGKQFLPASWSNFLAKTRIADVTAMEAQEIAVGLIEAAKQTSGLVPALNSIGGAVEAYFVGSSGPIKLQ
jgi:hypothetical protein